MEPGNTRKDSHLVEWVIWSALAVTIIVITGAFIWTRFYAERLDKPLLVSSSVPEFTLTNQFGQAVSLSNFLGHVVVADVIFTRCPVSCEQMSRRMRALQDQLGPRANVRFISITSDPLYDNPKRLRDYAQHHGAGEQWHFLTGIKRDVYKLAVDGLKFVVLDKTEQKVTDDDLFIHSTQFAVIDKRGRIRGYFEATDEEQRKQVATAVKMLARERL